MKFDLISLSHQLNSSLPVRERGLKFCTIDIRKRLFTVAPRAGAWIEIWLLCAWPGCPGVAPRAGAWIEICSGWLIWGKPPSLPVRERGLKLILLVLFLAFSGSLPVWERGLKSYDSVDRLTDVKSLPVRERGLKLITPLSLFRRMIVAPRAGAWIEIWPGRSLTR